MKIPLKVALVSEHADPLADLGGVDAGGQNVHVAALAAGLAARGHDVTVHTRLDAPGKPQRVVAPEGYTVDRVPAGPPTEVPKDDLLPHVPDLAERLAARWAADPPDVVHAHFWMSGLAARDALGPLAASTGHRPPLVQTFHALGTVKQRHQGGDDTSPAERVALETALCRDVDHVVATCSDEVAELRAMGLPPGRASVVPCGVDTDVFRPGPPVVPLQNRRTRRHRVLVVGRLVPRKGIATVVEALAGVPDAELLVAGGPPASALAADPEARRLRRLAEECGVADRVRLLGGVPQGRMPGLVRSADVVVSAPWYEPFGIAPLEAMACGRPVVATAVGGQLDTVLPGVTGELVPPRRPDLLGTVLCDLLADTARRRAYGVAGRRRALADFDWRRVVERTETVYCALVGRGAGAGTLDAVAEVAR